jgi:hypothetical protein
MQILIIGFQRSGTTLIRRLVTMHPEVKKILHENFLLSKYDTKNKVLQYVVSRGMDPYKDNWGDKTPFYPNIRKIPVDKYCKRWNEYFGESSRILHIVRHPIDVVNSIIKKYKGKQNIDKELKIYKKSMETFIPKMKYINNIYTFKYEDLLIYSDDIVPKIYSFCGLTSNINFRNIMSKIENVKYKKFDKSRAFAYRKELIKIETDLSNILNMIDSNIDGVKYEL